MAKLTARPRRSSPLNLPGAFKLFKPSRDLVLKNIWIFGPLYIAPLIFTAHASIWTPSATSQNETHWWWDYSWFGSGFSSSSVPSYFWYAFVGFSLLWFVIVISAGTILQIMAQQAQLDAAKGKE